MNLRNIILTIQCITIAGLFIESWIVVRRFRSVNHAWLLLSAVAALLNNTGYLMELTAKTQGEYMTALKFSYLGRNWYAFFMLFFCAEIVQVRIHDVVRKLLAALQTGVYIVILTAEHHRLYYTDMDFETGGIFPVLHHGNGIVHDLNMILQLLYTLFILIWIFRAMRREKRRNTRRGLVTFAMAAIVQAAFFVLQLIGIPGLKGVYDVSMIGYFLGTLLMLVAILSCDLMGTVEIIRDYVIDRISEGIIATDANGMVRYCNEPAVRLFPELERIPGITVQKDHTITVSGSVRIPEEITHAVRSGETITIGDRIYAPEENDLFYKGESSGKLYALVDETEHYRYMEELKKQREIADRANEAKSRFLANMSHEIRTPINAVLGMDEMILREAENDSVRSYAADIMSAGRTLLSLINDILDLSKVEEGRMEIIPVHYELSSLINDLVNMIRERAKQKGLDFLVDVDETIPHLLCGDEVRIRQCVLNLLTNAVKYTETGSVTLRVRYEKTGDEDAQPAHILLGFSVEDTGIGLKQADLNRLFVPYRRFEEERNRDIEGTGLGMSITAQLLDLMGSKLCVESEYGEGSVFAFAVDQEVVSPEGVGNFSRRYGAAAERTQPYRELFHAPNARILVVDDTEMNLTVIKSLLKKTRIRIDTAYSGRKALELAGTEHYDVIFIDHMMPEMDGIETLTRLREDGRNRETPAVALTANAVSGARETYLAAGFTDYLSKPVDGMKLERMLQSLLPANKLRDPAADAAEEERDKERKGRAGEPPAGDAGDGLPGWLTRIPELDTGAGMKNCGSAEGYLSVLRVFHETAADKAEEIDRFFREENTGDYTIRVHALKSSARIIGAAALSGLAAKLEQAGKDGDTELIRTENGRLVAMYRSLDEALSPLDHAGEDLPGIDPKALREAYQTIGEIAQSMDYELMEGILADLKGYHLPEQDAERIRTIGKMLTGLDWDGIAKIVTEAADEA
ncbi:MAG: response regulator [Lachnospiraceae bacterium]|nr:response regulator [Lachnospiraceae bacterium]